VSQTAAKIIAALLEDEEGDTGLPPGFRYYAYFSRPVEVETDEGHVMRQKMGPYVSAGQANWKIKPVLIGNAGVTATLRLEPMMIEA
jgi:hypothetical protein